MSQLDFTLFLFHYLNIITIFYFFMCLIIIILVGEIYNNKIRTLRKKG